MNLIARVIEAPLGELAADAAQLVDDLADHARTPDGADIRVTSRSPIRVAVLALAPPTSEAADLLAIAAVPGAFGGHAFRWRRDGTTIDARDQFGAALKHVPDHQKIIARGDRTMLLTSVLRAIQRPAPASIVIDTAHYMLVPELTVGRTAIADVVIADPRLAKIAWSYEWSDDAWWVRAAPGHGNITFHPAARNDSGAFPLAGETRWNRRELAHGDVVASGELAARFVAAD